MKLIKLSAFLLFSLFFLNSCITINSKYTNHAYLEKVSKKEINQTTKHNVGLAFAGDNFLKNSVLSVTVIKEELCQQEITRTFKNVEKSNNMIVERDYFIGAWVVGVLSLGIAGTSFAIMNRLSMDINKILYTSWHDVALGSGVGFSLLGLPMVIYATVKSFQAKDKERFLEYEDKVENIQTTCKKEPVANTPIFFKFSNGRTIEAGITDPNGKININLKPLSEGLISCKSDNFDLFIDNSVTKIILPSALHNYICDYEKVRLNKSYDNYINFVKKYPQSGHINEIKDILATYKKQDYFEYSLVKRNNRIFDWEIFISLNAESSYINEAKKQLFVLLLDKAQNSRKDKKFKEALLNISKAIIYSTEVNIDMAKAELSVLQNEFPTKLITTKSIAEELYPSDDINLDDIFTKDIALYVGKVVVMSAQVISKISSSSYICNFKNFYFHIKLLKPMELSVNHAIEVRSQILGYYKTDLPLEKQIMPDLKAVWVEIL